MKLLLTSQGTINKSVQQELFRLNNKEPKETNLLFITTATKPKPNPYMESEVSRLVALGFKVKLYDFEAKKVTDIEAEINSSDIIFIIGGEPFYLLRALRKSGLETILKKQDNNKLFVGASAGTYAACPSMEMGLWKKPNRNTYGLTDFAGMSLVNFLIFCHHENKYNDLLLDKIKNTKYKIYALTDDQAISVENNKIKFIN